jgi:ergothioneine biosynthesis protein EgtB
MPDVSPTKWHLAHTSWFFEAFVLSEVDKNYKSLHPQYNYLFNSYYVQVGERFYRPQRGLLSRPTVKNVFEYRAYVNEKMIDFFNNADEKIFNKIAVVIDIGLHHEQQHQELMVTDIKHVFSVNPLYPKLVEAIHNEEVNLPKIKWIEVEGGLKEIGFGGEGFFYDNEQPRHKVYLNDFKIASRLITNGEYIEFIESGAYEKDTLWLSDGIAAVRENNWHAPLYWVKKDNEWWHYTLQGFRKVEPDEPVTHISFYEAEAFARWAGARLATEFEWETASQNIKIEGNFAEKGLFHPEPLSNDVQIINQMFGDVWEWTRSDYAPYPGYKVPDGAIGEYNGKFMSGQYVLRGGSCATSQTHIRNTYRNFFSPASRWQFMGIRLAKDADE